MEAAVSAYAANSKWCLGLGRRQMEGFGSSKQSLLLSLSIGGGGVGCCNWSSSRKRRINNMNCMKRFRLESTSMGMGMGVGPRAAIERRQSLKGKGRFVRAEAASALGGGEDVENGDVILPELSIRVAMQRIVGELVSALERQQSLKGKGRFLRAEAASTDVENGDVIVPHLSIRVTMQEYVGAAVSALEGEVVENGDVILPEASVRVAMQQLVGEGVSALGGDVVENGNVIIPEVSIRVVMQECLDETISELGGEVVENDDIIIFPEAAIHAMQAQQGLKGKGRFVIDEAASALGVEVVENGDVIIPHASIRVVMQQYVGKVVSAFGGEVVENGDDIIFPEASVRVAMQHFVGEVVSVLGGEVVENGDVKFTEASIRGVAMQKILGEVVYEFGGEVVENGDILIYPGAAIRAAIRAITAYIRVPMKYVRPACVGLGGVMLGVGCYLAPKITNVAVKAVVMFGIPIAIMTLVHVKEFEEFKQVLRNRKSVPLASVFKHVGLALLTGATAMFQVGYFLMSYTSCSRITSALIALALMVFVYFLADDTPPVLINNIRKYMRKERLKH